MASPRSGSSIAMPLRPALTTRDSEDAAMSPRTTPKVVSIAEPENENISPLLASLDGNPKKQYNAGVARRLSGRPPSVSSSRNSLASQKSLEDLPEAALATSNPRLEPPHAHRHRNHKHAHDKLLTQVAEWLQAEKAKRAAKKAKKYNTSAATLPDEADVLSARPSSRDSDSSALSLEKLQRILEENMTDYSLEPDASPSPGPGRLPQARPRRRSSSKLLSRMASSDTEYHDGDVILPTCDVVLDNSKTLSYTGGASESTPDACTPVIGKRVEKERKAWSTFKSEILRLAHTLRLKGWRRVPLENGGDIEVERLSGALTNAVYVVSPPKNLPQPSSTDGSRPVSKKPPQKLLLRIYGPQVEHLIDRDNELGILRRLARKKIGPRLLGTFINGRFEEYFESTTLTSADLRVPETSKQIAKRMRELHEGIELLAQERENGPFVWLNWDKWVGRCELVVKYLDDQILSGKAGKASSKSEAWKDRGLVCGVEWPIFRAVIEKYRKFLIDQYGGAGEIRKQLVFAHNDTQYGNILRLKPSGESPLLLPANSHKQLVVIDFEYASANTPGLEFANHFTEWCYNYHDPVSPHACNTSIYPIEEEQKRFIKSYVNHRPQFAPKASATPTARPSPGLQSSISDFLLDSRTPGEGGVGIGGIYAEEEAERERETERRVEELLREARLWRIANSAQWVAWGIVQAKVPELEDVQLLKLVSSPDQITPMGQLSDPLSGTDPLSNESKEKKHSHEHDQRPSGLVAEALLAGAEVVGATVEVATAEADEEEEFDYLGYAHERACFFWGDVVSLGLVQKEELPESLRGKLKVVPY